MPWWAARSAIVTPKPQTTRHRILGMVNRPEAQLVLVDTPGLHESTRRVMNQYMNRVAISSSPGCRCHPVRDRGAAVHRRRPVGVGAGARLEAARCSLVVNKVDRVFPKDQLLPFLEELTARAVPASGIVPISALESDNLDRLVDVIGRDLPVSPPLFAAGCGHRPRRAVSCGRDRS